MMEQDARSAHELLAPFRVDPGEAPGATEVAAVRARMVPALRGALRRAVVRRAAVRRWRTAGLAADSFRARRIGEAVMVAGKPLPPIPPGPRALAHCAPGSAALAALK